ncbi:MAG: thiamine phosphate synthase [Myxococcota bacterium]
MIAGVVAITDPSHSGWLDQALAAIRADVPWLQLRARQLSFTERLQAAQTLAAACNHTQLLINTDLDIALRVGAAGLQLPRTAPPVEILRQQAAGRTPTRLIMVRACHSAEQIVEAHRDGADAATLSPVFPPGSKPNDTRPTLGLEKLAQICAQAPLPIIALGGITPERAMLCRQAGAAGVAAISALFGMKVNTAEAARAMCSSWNHRPPTQTQ